MNGIIISSEGLSFKTLAANSIALAPLVTAYAFPLESKNLMNFFKLF